MGHSWSQNLSSLGSPPGRTVSANAPGPLTNLVVHDGTQTHDADVDVILLADDAGIPQGLPAMGRGQPGQVGRRQQGSESQTQLPIPPTTQVATGVRGGTSGNFCFPSTQPKRPAEGRKSSSVLRPGAWHFQGEVKRRGQGSKDP